MQTTVRAQDSVAIIRSLKSLPQSRLARVSILDLCSSTNDYLLSRTPPAKGKFDLCVAFSQSAGRGRRGKKWYSYHDGIYLSVSWQCGCTAQHGGWLVAMTAVRLAESLEALGIHGIGIKWPNDLYYQRAKLAGILVEYKGDTAVMGIGLNITTPSVAPGRADGHWVGLAQTGVVLPSYPELLAITANAALAVHERIAFKDGRRRFSKFDLLYNCSIKIKRKTTQICGVVLGIDKHARLLVDSGGYIGAYDNGEINVCYDRTTD